MRGAAVAFLLVLSACGGSNGGGGGLQPQPNNVPAFTSAATVTVVENTAGTLQQATATDPDGDAITFAINSGADSTRFLITPGGALSFVTPPDFESPADANSDNVYEVRLQVSDGSAVAVLDVRVTVADDPNDALAVRRVGAGLNAPYAVTPVPGDQLLFVLDGDGRIVVADPASGASSVFMTVPGARSIVAAPDYATTGMFYVFVRLYEERRAPDGTIEGGFSMEIRRYRRASRLQGDPASVDVILREDGRPAGFGSERLDFLDGWLGFGPDGLLYVISGDNGSTYDTSNAFALGFGQNLESLLGKVLRIDVGRDDFPADSANDYGAPADNPVLGNGRRNAIFALGIHNPHGASFDGGNLLFGDGGMISGRPVSGRAREEINLLRAADAGANYGWPRCEGRSGNCAGSVLPVVEILHAQPGGSFVVGGIVYRGAAAPLTGRYLFADALTGAIWAAPAPSLAQGTTLTPDGLTRVDQLLVPNVGAINRVTGFGRDGQGNLFILDNDGDIFVVLPT